MHMLSKLFMYSNLNKMANLRAIFVLFVCFKLISGYAIVGDDDNQIIWPSEYHFKGEKIDFVTTLKGPFEIWYSSGRNRSRVDFYGGTTKKYYYGDLGIIYMVIPTSDMNLVSDVVCLTKSCRNEQLDFMPDVSTSTYTRTGETKMLFDKLVDVWKSSEPYEGDMVLEKTLNVHRTENGFDIPVQYEIKLYNIDLGKVMVHFIKNYYNFHDTVSEEELEMKVPFCSRGGELGEHFKTDILMLHPDIPQEVDIAFDSYTRHHSKDYQEKEREMRKIIFAENWRMVHEHNRQNLGYKLELNQFSDKTNEELSYLTGTFVSKHPFLEVQAFPHTLEEIDDLAEKLPKNYDLRIEGVVTTVKHQGDCKSCWAFSTTAAVEGAVARINGNRLLDLSEQSLIDCAWTYDNYGCKGGTQDGAMKYVLANGIPTEKDYGIYTEHDGYCKILNMTDVYKIKGFAQVTPRNPNAMKVALHKYGPITVVIHASKQMTDYSNGIFYDFSCANATINHGVTVVGYGNRHGEDYWIIKNSWGEAWGQDGYILMSAKDNNCFVLDSPYYAIV